MSSDSDEEIFSRYATNERRVRPRKLKSAFMRKKCGDKQRNKSNSQLHITPARVYLFNFFLFSCLGSLMPFLPVFFKLLGFSSLQNGFLFAVRPLISFWWGPLSASIVTSSKYRQLLLFILVAGSVTGTFCLSVVRTNDGGILSNVNCETDTLYIGTTHLDTDKSKNSANDSHFIDSAFSIGNETKPYSWKTYIEDASRKVYHELKKGILMKKLFISVLTLTIVSEVFISPTLHVTQASIRFSTRQPFLNSQCLNRVFCKIGMTVAALSISYVAWKYQCIFTNVHYFYFHFYGFLATGCITAMVSLILPTESPRNASFVTMVCNNFLSVVFNCNNFGYIFGLWIGGIAEGVISAYLLWYATENGATELIVGILVTLATVTDMILHFTVGYSMKWIGHIGLLSVGIFLLSIQFFVLANVTNPYYIIPTQLLFGAASCCIRSSFIGCANSNGTKEMEKVMFFVFQASYMGLGLGLGSFFIAMPYYVFGARKTFSALSVMTGAYVMVSFIVQLISCRRGTNKDHDLVKGRYAKVNSCEPNTDWLVDAMREEEEQQQQERAGVLELEGGWQSAVELHSSSSLENNNGRIMKDDVEENIPAMT